ncbi:MAG: pyridoxamine 5'-phosphate oxidase family protein [Candidatus Omnitrophota bacterium]|nr:MAG: pyridoxamine 5'-phosphate oxidase family protein [Candidatus Omnitrophota bacterium]
MNLKDYFKNTNGFGVLSTADDKGKVDAAAYAKPKVLDDKHIAFIMGDKLTHANLEKNPYAVYLFRKNGPGYEGKRLYLKKDSETKDKKIIENTCKEEWPGPYCAPHYLEGAFLVNFKVESILPMVVYDKKKK